MQQLKMSLTNKKVIHQYQEDYTEFKGWEKVQIKAEFLFSFHLGNNYAHMQNYAVQQFILPPLILPRM